MTEIRSGIEVLGNLIFPRVVFRERFTGDGSDTTFQLSGTDNSAFNAEYKTGGWSASRIQVALPSHVTGTDKKPTYDSVIPVSRNRISVSSVSASGLVTLDYAPRDGIDIYIYYWYELASTDMLDTYYREDFVASMEEQGSALGSDIVLDTTDFNNYLSVADTTVQKAFDTLDDIVPYTDENAQDAIGGILDDGTVGNIVFTYNDVSGTISAITQDSEIDHDSLLNFVAEEHFLQSAITEVGTIGTGVWEGTSIGVGYTDAKCTATWPNTYTANQNLTKTSTPEFVGQTLTTTLGDGTSQSQHIDVTCTGTLTDSVFHYGNLIEMETDVDRDGEEYLASGQWLNVTALSGSDISNLCGQYSKVTVEAGASIASVVSPNLRYCIVSDSVPYLYGCYNYNDISGFGSPGTVGVFIGNNFLLSVADANATVTTAKGSYTSISRSAGTLTTAIGHESSLSGTIGTVYAFKGAITGTITNKWGVYITGSEKNYVEGEFTLDNAGLHLLDTNASHDLIIKPGSDLTADRTTTITTGDNDRIFSLLGNLTIESSSLINQDLTTDATGVKFGTMVLGTHAINAILDARSANSGDYVPIIFGNTAEAENSEVGISFVTSVNARGAGTELGGVRALITQADPSTLQSALRFLYNSGDSVDEGMRLNESGLTFVDGLYIAVDKIRARNGDGLYLVDDGGNGIFVQDSTGNVGIGTTGPVGLLHVEATTGYEVATGMVYLKKSYATNHPVLVIEQSNAGGNQNTEQGLLVDVQGTGAGNGRAFHVKGQGDSRFVVLNGGNVGIGKTSPGAKLHLFSSEGLTGEIIESTATSDAELEFRNPNGGNATWAIGLDYSNSKAFGIAYAAAEGASLTGQNVFTIDTSGNVGIGISASIAARVHAVSITEQLRVGYNVSNFASFTVGSGGNLTLAPSGGTFDVTGNISLQSGSGSFYSNDGSQGISDTFTNGDGDTVTIKNGIITNIV